MTILMKALLLTPLLKTLVNAALLITEFSYN
jgi:hypothetical protein